MVETEPKLFLIQGDVYEVEKLVAVKIVKGKKLFRVRWRGYSKESDTLEPEENLLSCKDMILDLEEKIRMKHDRKKNKKPFKSLPFTKELRSTISSESKIPSDATWQASEVLPNSGNNSKDTFWRDFDEGKISVSDTVYDKDMYSKVKERAAVRVLPSDGIKCLEPGQKDPPSPLLCPKVVLKRKPVQVPPIERPSPCNSLHFRPTFKVKPIGMQAKKRKRYDVLRDYRKRKNRMHRKRKLDENGRRELTFRTSESHGYECTTQSGSNILQELLINDELKSPGYVLSPGISEGIVTEVNMTPPKEPAGNDGERKKNHPLMCRISIQDNSMAFHSSFKTVPKPDIMEERPLQKCSVSSKDIATQKVFMLLWEAVVNDRLEKVERLCSNIYAVNSSQDDGTTALMVAAQLGRYFVTRILLKANAHKDKQNKQGETALMMACKKGQLQIAKLLLEHGANFALTNLEGNNVLRIVKQSASQSDIHAILIEHIVRVVSQFESGARCQVRHIAQIKYALFPIQCFSLNEGPKYSIYFHHHVKLESPEKNGSQNLLFIARATIKNSSVQCQFDADSLVHYVAINGVKQTLFSENISSVFKVTGLQNGSNKVSIITAHYPESEVKLIVCAYKVHRSFVCFPTQKLKSD